MDSTPHTTDPRLQQVLNFPLVNGIFGRRSRRVGFGMSIPGGPLAYTSHNEPLPLCDLELALLVSAATGVTGWNFGIPYTLNQGEHLSNYSLRLTGRTVPSAASICTSEVFFTDDSGIYIVRTRDITPEKLREFEQNDDITHIINISQAAIATTAMELSTICQNIVLMMQAIGLGGWMYSGIFPYSILGAFADEGISGLGFRFTRSEDWILPNPVGLD